MENSSPRILKQTSKINIYFQLQRKSAVARNVARSSVPPLRRHRGRSRGGRVSKQETLKKKKKNHLTLLFRTIKHNGDFIKLAGNRELIKEPCYKDNKTKS